LALILFSSQIDACLWSRKRLPGDISNYDGTLIAKTLKEVWGEALPRPFKTEKKIMETLMVQRSFIIPVLSMGNGERLNILGLLKDLETIDGEVICIFNSDRVFEQLRRHPRIDKFCYNKQNPGVSRSWNMGINLVESPTAFILNEDIHVDSGALLQMEKYLYALPKAVMVSPQGSYLDFSQLRVIRYFKKGEFDQPVLTHDVSGFLFAIHMERFLDHKLRFDVRYSPCFMEEWDMGVQVMKSGLACYTVPVTAFEHDWGISGDKANSPISYFGKTVFRNDVLIENRQKFMEKWFKPNPVNLADADNTRKSLLGESL
jgi:hypothetical protein